MAHSVGGYDHKIGNSIYRASNALCSWVTNFTSYCSNPILCKRPPSNGMAFSSRRTLGSQWLRIAMETNPVSAITQGLKMANKHPTRLVTWNQHHNAWEITSTMQRVIHFSVTSGRETYLDIWGRFVPELKSVGEAWVNHFSDIRLYDWIKKLKNNFHLNQNKTKL